ncbi:hypothetical protein [uncultured Lacinutrix sp.]|uniref:hypothetical protein n=1 Tax=uncultured Lacinutrix sp. TaxID=574032 RepID=UPI0026318737|nr:hypothetical protein [uncultured Lacinutrix sp.]
MEKETQSTFLSITNKPLIIGLASGLPALLHYYSSNFTQVNSWSQFFFFFSFYVLSAVIILGIVALLLKFIKRNAYYRDQIFITLNLIWFLSLTLYSTIGLGKKRLLVIILVAVLLGFLLKKYINKIVGFQLILALIMLINFAPKLFKHLSYSQDWMQQPDGIETLTFKKKPNIYIIQPDGYVNASTLKHEPYKLDNSSFEDFLESNKFKIYQDFRSNYYSTLSSNASLFAMKHHYFFYPESKVNELYNARSVIAGDNPVVSLFKKNDYKTFLLLQKNYLLVNRPKIMYDYCNVNYSDMSFITRGFGQNHNTLEILPSLIESNKNTSNFYFIEQISPAHIASSKSYSQGKEKERKDYLERLQKTNTWLKEITSLINNKDPEALIVIVADHGGFVGFDATEESRAKQEDSVLVNSIFSSLLAVKWPENDVPDFDYKLKTNVNLFRVISGYLSENESVLNHLEKNSSYNIIEKGADYGVYELINGKGETVFNKVKK